MDRQSAILEFRQYFDKCVTGLQRVSNLIGQQSRDTPSGAGCIKCNINRIAAECRAQIYSLALALGDEFPATASN